MRIEPLNSKNKQKALSLLKRYQESSLMLLGNLKDYGASLTDRLFSGNFKCLIKNSHVVAVFCLARNGMLLIQTDRKENYSKFILEACQTESIKIKGLMGDYTLIRSLFKYFQKINPSFKLTLTFSPREILYSCPLRALKKRLLLQNPADARLLIPTDFSQWNRLRKNYFVELGIPSFGNKKSLLRTFSSETKTKSWWGYFIGEKLVSMAAFRASFDKMAQIGSVYTIPKFRRMGYSKTCILKLMKDALSIHKIDTLVLFTPENNPNAQKLYKKLGFKKIGYFGTILGK